MAFEIFPKYNWIISYSSIYNIYIQQITRVLVAAPLKKISHEQLYISSPLISVNQPTEKKLGDGLFG